MFGERETRGKKRESDRKFDNFIVVVLLRVYLAIKLYVIFHFFLFGLGCVI